MVNEEDIPTTEQLGFSMDNYLKKNLALAKEVVRKDWDMVFVVDGSEGSGKSVLAMQCAYFCDPTINIDRIAFTPKEFKKAVLSADKYQSVIYDEAYTGLSSRAAMSLINKTLVQMLAEIRQKNLFVFVVMPTFFDLDKYVALWRSRALIHVYTKENFQRGFFCFFNVDKKKSLYLNGKKYYHYGATKADFIGRFPNIYTVDEKKYRDKKTLSLSNKVDEEGDAELMEKVEEVIFERLMNPQLNIPNVEKIKIFGKSDRSFYYKIEKMKENGDFAKDLSVLRNCGGVS